MIPKKILVIDDEALVADISRMALGSAGHDVSCAYSGEQAVEMAMTSHFDLAIVDAILPGMTGIETFDVIRQSKPGIIGILVTGHSSYDMVIEAINKGFSGVLKKPLDSRELRKSVQEAFAIAALREENTRLKTILPLYKLGEEFIAATSVEDVYELCIDAIDQQINVPAISIMMFVEEANCLQVVSSKGMDKSLAAKVAIKPGESIAGWVYEHGEAVIFNKQSQEQSQLAQHLKRDEINASISFPLIGHEKTLGVLNITQTAPDIEYTQSDIELLSVICGQAVMAIENITTIKEREQNARIKAMFEQYVAPEVAEILIRSGGDIMEVGGIREVTVLFADIRNFTLAVQHLTPQDTRLFLTRFFDLFADVAFSWKGTLDKFMGDAALVAFGAPIELEQPSHAAVCTAVELSLGFEKLRKEWLQKDDVFKQLGLGIGISRGEVFHGNVGSSRRLDYTVIGTDVNIAQRLASATASGQILITESVVANMDSVDNGFPIQNEKPQKLRGLEHEIQLYSIHADQVDLPLNRLR